MEKTIKSAKIIGEPFPTDHGLLYMFGVECTDGYRCVANGKTVSPWWSAPGTKVLIMPKGETTKRGIPKVKIGKIDGESFKSNPKAKGGSQYDPLPGFCSQQLFPAIQLCQADNGHVTYTVEQVIEKMKELHALHDRAVNTIREDLNKPKETDSDQAKDEEEGF